MTPNPRSRPACGRSPRPTRSSACPSSPRNRAHPPVARAGRGARRHRDGRARTSSRGKDVTPTSRRSRCDARARAALAARPRCAASSTRRASSCTPTSGAACCRRPPIAAVTDVAGHYSTLEYDVESGERGSRHVHVESAALPAHRRRGRDGGQQQRRRGAARHRRACPRQGSDRQPRAAGRDRRQLPHPRHHGRVRRDDGRGRHHQQDAPRATTRTPSPSDTGLLLKVHSSNFRVVGFTEEVSVAELVQLGRHARRARLRGPGLGRARRPRASTAWPTSPRSGASIAAGADLVSCSGDKLLGGPQAGILCGRWDIIQRLKKHPMARAVRLDKMTLAALEATLRAYLDDGARRCARSPRCACSRRRRPRSASGRMRSRTRFAQSSRRERSLASSTAEDISRAGGGALPLADIPTCVVAIAPLP